MFDLYSCNALSARVFDVDRALNSYFMIMIMTTKWWKLKSKNMKNIHDEFPLLELDWA